MEQFGVAVMDHLFGFLMNFMKVTTIYLLPGKAREV